jgi:hypothetical protein
LQQRGYDFQVAQFLANIAMGTGALSGSTTSGGATQPRGFFSNRGGFKTGESLHRSKKAYGGGLDPNSMGGAVYEPGAFERGGYATQGAVVDATDLAAILAQQRQSFGPFAAAGPYGQAAGATPHGPGGIVPQQQMHVPKLMVARPMSTPKASPGAGSDLGKVYSLANEATTGLTGKGLTERAGEKMGLRDSPEKIAEAKGANMPGASANATTGNQNPSGGVVPTPAPRDPTATSGSEGLWDKLTGLFKSEGGGIMPRHRYADGGGEDSQGEEAIPHDPSDVMSGKDPMEGVLKAGSQKHEMLKPANLGGSGGGGGGGSSKLGLGKLAGSAIGSAFGPLGSMAGGFLGGLLPFNEGGVVPRQHFQDGGPEDSFERALRTTLGHEGGYTVDTGGPTMKGISSRANPDVDLERVGKDPEYTRGIYRERYWNPIGASEMDPKFAGVAFDAATNHGVGKTKQMLEEAGGDPAKLLQLRQQHYDQLVTSNPEKYGQYARGWNNRLNSFAKELGMEPLAYAGSEGGMGRAAGQQAIQRATSGEGLGANKTSSFIDGIGFNKQTILPLLQGIGAMASSKSISPWAAALQGLGAGAKAYGEEETRQAGTSLTDAQTVNQFMDAARKALMANPANPNVLMVLTPRGWMTQGQAQRLGLPTIGAPLPAAAGATALRRQGSQQSGLGPFDAGQVDVTSATTPQAPKVDAISEVIPPSQNKVQPLGMPGAYYDTQARTAAQADAGSSNISAAQSEEVRKDIDRAAREASAGKPIMNDLTQNTAALIANPAAGSGPFANPRKSILSVADYASRLLLGKELPAEFSPSDLEVNKKIASYLAGQQTSSVNQNSLQAFTTALSAAPNSELSPQALAKITALLMVQKSRAERIGEFARVYGEDAEGRLSANVIRQYDRIHGRQMQEEQNSLADFFVKYPKAAQKVAKGEIPYDVAAQKFKDLYGRPDMAYHFQNR